MNINEYAATIAASIENAEVVEVEKNGYIRTGIQFTTGERTKATFYINDLYKSGVDTEDAIEKAREVVKKEQGKTIDVNFVDNFESVRPRLRARLVNKRAATATTISRSAAPHGFDDLIITAHIMVNVGNGEASIKVTSDIIKMWGVTSDLVLDIAEENSRKDAAIDPLPIPFPFTIVSNRNTCYGAYGIIAKMDEIRAKFPSGFTVIPSSVHEVLVTDILDKDAIDAMIQDVNRTEVNEVDLLSNHAYVFVA